MIKFDSNIETMKYDKISNQLFTYNRKQLAKKMSANSLAIFYSNDQMPTNADGTMPFKQNSDLFWLTGVDQEDSILIIYCDENAQANEILFVKETSELIAIWEGEKLSKVEAFNTSGIKNVLGNDQFETKLDQLINQFKIVYLNSNEHSRASSKVETQTDRMNKWFKEKYESKKIEFKKNAPHMHDLRAVKSKTEIDLMQLACNITESGFKRVLKFVKPGVTEFEIEAEFMHEFLRKKSKGFAYEPIIASGRNACVLHYTDNNKECKNGDVILMDVGAEYANYASDMTRCIPVNGTFSERQKQVYNAVLRVMKEAASMLRPGTMLSDYHKEVGLVMQSELIDLGLIDHHDVSKQDPKKPAYKKYFMHGTSHFLGLDVHDVGLWDKPISEGMVFTCEPGIYILEENLGIRLENDLLITKNEPFDLMKNIPIEADEIEYLMNKN